MQLKEHSPDRRLRLGNLPRPSRSYARQVVIVAVVASLIIVLYGLRLYPFEATAELPERLSPVRSDLALPLSLIATIGVGLGFVTSALYYASYQTGWMLPFVTRLILGMLTLTFPASFVKTALTLGVGGSAGSDLFPLIFVVLAVGCGIVALACAFVSTAWAERWAPRFVAGAFIGSTVFLLAVGLRGIALDRLDLSDRALSSGVYDTLAILVSYLASLVGVASVIFFWQAITEIKVFSRDIGLRVADASDRVSWLLGVLFAIKAGWLATGYWRVLRGASGEVWQNSAEDGPIGWFLATCFAVLAGLWLAKWQRPVDSAPSAKGAIFLTGGFLWPFFAAFVLFIPATFLTSIGLDAAGLWLGTISVFLAEFGISWPVLFASLLIPLGLLGLRIANFRYLAPVLLLTGSWALPSVLQLIVPGSNSSFEYLTFDVALTLTLFFLAVLLWRNKQHKATKWVVTLVLVVSTLVALADSLIPADQAYLGFALLLVFPLVYQLLFDSATLNLEDATHGQRVIRSVGLQAALMLLVASAVVLGLMSPNQPAFEDVANKIFLPPVLALSLAAVITNREGFRAISDSITNQ